MRLQLKLVICYIPYGPETVFASNSSSSYLRGYLGLLFPLTDPRPVFLTAER